ncbi:receptor-type tyrosine-protein phosphatase N2 isoform X1 [Neodiprion virginianus]|uniref:receptor-type tyrosine-protein phosphatase N2 isoform X1 n=1 Tax=Neodiprion virginianus TaxID=2961670 RepID=UPI001EE70D95|nr:receptor-type tyrosine-protein phosphatase N2 isoform X1 [Neodiprion virginianus]XP_046621980.1 receptor-type tyrosine-protein phosphatase N2 isoform X1 [Neodiprion virginianus]XP_046621981.1 receptor-type tyrosine-protein phosphatase N2 isoform X1 [Neodiprion virginianus]
MGRKKWWRGGLELLLLLCVSFHGILSDGDVGCLFSENLCQPDVEFCYNDLAFGRCLQKYGNIEDDDLYKYDLRPNQLQLLRVQLEELAIDGYRWSHPYTQCIIQRSLYALRFRTPNEGELCNRLKEKEKHQFIGDDGIDEGNDVHSQKIAIVKFTPSEEDPHGDFADELYYPPGVEKEVPKFFIQDIGYPNAQEIVESDYNERSGGMNNAWGDSGARRELGDISLVEDNFVDPERMVKKKSLLLDNFGGNGVYEFDPKSIRNYQSSLQQNYIDAINRRFQEERDSHLERIAKKANLIPDDQLEFLTDQLLGNVADFKEQEIQQPLDNYEKEFSRKYKYPRELQRSEIPKEASLWLDQNVRDSNIGRFTSENEDNDFEIGRGDLEKMFESQLANEPSRDAIIPRQNGMYTEGGLVNPLKYGNFKSAISNENDFNNDDFANHWDALLFRRELAGFKRHERLDVKKPGPPFATNNYAFKTQSAQNTGFLTETPDDAEDERQQREPLLLPLVKKELTSSTHKLKTTGNSYKNVDMDHVYMQFKGEFGTWSEGEHVINEVGRLLGLEPNTLTDIRVQRAEVTFKVKPDNSKGYNATDVANKIDGIRGQLKDSLQVEVLRAGIGDKAKLPAILQVGNESELSAGSFNALLAAGLAAAGAAAAVTLYIARRHAKSRTKLAGLAIPDPEASKDYQDLCRVRMQAKQPAEKPDSPRVVNLSRESESNNSPSSRSSTSSWSEEPALSNMDISTGHMVLSYMEDHLKNKDRLDQEWTALCAYEAEPSSTAVAEDEENAKRNRSGASLPYDHSRVVLNDLANINNSDYINASTIKPTDHDPRNPAYIATQGALPQTAADFWQLVWEQGSVVIVMLTRLTEEGHAMCHRYWPEEGSELYHIYEVHLVSEHIWCDDYLVRSFYLKNLRTGETRTVTQFHFLSWPENGVPHSTKALLEFRRKVNKSYRGRSCPIVVHCSDGAGRTGTYCLIDMVLNRMAKGAKEIDIAATLEHIRDQRPGMVATKQQFEFVLMAVAEEVHAILKALPIPPADKSAAPTTTTVSPPVKGDQ